nr:hypothetical protein BAU18_03545 [Enterococcus diestrammenae]
MSCICIGRKPWKYEFAGIIQKVMANSVLIIIMSTDPADDCMIDQLKGKTVISKKSIRRLV